MKKLLLLMIIAPLALAAVPLKWNVETSRINEMRFDAYHGETLDFEAAFNTLGKPLDLSSSSATLYYQTNGMDQAWWSAPGTITGNVARATFTPAMDPGEKQIYAFLAISGSESNQNYRAAARIFFKNSPGAFPNQIEPPAVRLDFNALEIANPPWPAEISAATNEVLQSALSADTALSNNLARAIADAQPADYANVSNRAVHAVLTSELGSLETDPRWEAEKFGYATKADINTLNERDIELEQMMVGESEINEQKFYQINRALNAKQDMLKFDSTPTFESQNPVTSHGIKTAIDAATSAVASATNAVLQSALSADTALSNNLARAVASATNAVLQSALSADTALSNNLARAVASAYKPKQSAVASPSAATTEAYQFIDTVAQDANGVITATKKTMRKATTSAPGMVQLNDNIDSTRTDHAATANAVRKVAENVTSATNTLDSALREWADGEITIRLATTNAFISVSNGVQRIYEVDGTNKTLKWEWNMNFAAISNTVNQLVTDMLRKKEDSHDWANYAASGTLNPFPGAVSIDRTAYFASSNVVWEAHDGFAVMTAHLPLSASGNASQFRIGIDLDDWFGMEVTASYLIDAIANSFVRDGTTCSISTVYDATYLAVPPRVYFTTSLAEPFAELTSGIAWTHSAAQNKSTVVISGQTSSSGFYFLKKEEAGGAIFRSTMPILPEGYRVENESGNYVGTLQPDSIISVTQNGKNYILFAQEVE